MSLPKSFDLKAADGKTIKIPSVGFGTWAEGGTGWCKASVLEALKVGYRHLDCAWMYGVDEEVGAAIKESGIPREELFITTKFWPHFGHPDNVELCLDKCLKGMGLDYVDLYLAHWPIVTKAISRQELEKASANHEDPGDGGQLMDDDDNSVKDWEYCSANIAKRFGKQGSFVPTWKAMQELVKKGKTRTVGVSNFSIRDLEDLLEDATEVPVSCNQVEVHPWLPNTELIIFAQKHGILTTCYSPFAGQKEDGATLLKDDKVLKLAEKNEMDVGQMLQSWAVQRGTAPLGKSATPARIKSNIDIKRLSDEDMRALDSLAIADGKGRTIDFIENGADLFQL